MVYGEIQEALWIIYETIIREIKEETNLHIKKENLKVFNIYSGEEQHHIYPNKDEVYFVNIIFETNIYSGEIVGDSESYELLAFSYYKQTLSKNHFLFHSFPFCIICIGLYSLKSCFMKLVFILILV